jgi:hypothetical protein
VKFSALANGTRDLDAAVVAGAVVRGFTLGTVDEGDVVVDLVGGDGVFELRVLACDDAVGGADFKDDAAGGGGAEGLGVRG